MTAAKTTAERQRALRERRAQEGRSEVRGIYARPEHHARIKQYAARIAKDDQYCSKKRQ